MLFQLHITIVIYRNNSSVGKDQVVRVKSYHIFNCDVTAHQLLERARRRVIYLGANQRLMAGRIEKS